MRDLVIIPSIRNPQVISDYSKNIDEHKFSKKNLFFLIITEDFLDKKDYKDELSKNGLEGEVFNLQDREKFMDSKGLSKYKDIIPRKSHAETSFGLIYMWFNKEFRYGFFIDDDTKPLPSFNYFEEHIKNLEFSGTVESVSSNNGWVNVLYQTFNEHKLYPRGFPYSKMKEATKIKSTAIKKGEVYISQGLWTNVPDLDAIRILMDGDLNGQAKTRLKESNFTKNFIVERGNFQTVCSMNLAFRREIIPAFYQMPMDDNPYKVGRFDDIWSGLVAKFVLDRINKYIINCYPLCQHNKAPRSTFKDVSAEAPGYETNEYISDVIGNTKTNSKDIIGISRAVAAGLESNSKTEFMKYCGTSFSKWLKMFESI